MNGGWLSRNSGFRAWKCFGGFLALVLGTTPSLFGAVFQLEEDLERWVHQGRSSFSVWEKALEANPTPEQSALIWSALLVPERVRLAGTLDSRFPEPTSQEKLKAGRVVQQFLLTHPNSMHADVLMQRLRGQLGVDGLKATIDSIKNAPSEKHLSVALQMFLHAPWSDREVLIEELVLDASLDDEARATLLSEWIERSGREACIRFWAAFGANAPEASTRALIRGWPAAAIASDHEVFLELATHSDDRTALSAQLRWAQHETDPSRRLGLFERSLLWPNIDQESLWKALSRQGVHQGIALRLRPHLTSSNRDEQRTSFEYLPYFMDSEAWLQELFHHLGPTTSPVFRGACMIALARLSQVEAQARAAEWFAGGGWRSDYGEAVGRELSSGPVLDAHLDDFFAMQELPNELGLAIALPRAPHSPSARAWLRTLCEEGGRNERESAAMALAKAGHPSDFPLLLGLLADPNVEAYPRSLILRELGNHPLVFESLEEWFADPPQDYEVLEAWVDSLVRHGAQHPLRGAMLNWLAEENIQDNDTQLALQLTAWSAQHAAPVASECGYLLTGVGEVLTTLPFPHKFDRGMPDQWTVAAEFSTLHQVGRAFREAMNIAPSPEAVKMELHKELRPLLGQVSPAALLHLFGLLPPGSCDDLAKELVKSIGPEHPLRIVGLGTWLAHAPSLVEEQQALRALLADPYLVARNPWDLLQGLNQLPVRGWVLPADRLADWYLLSQLEAGGTKKELESITRHLLAGFTAWPVLLDAAQHCAGFPSLQGPLLRRAYDWAPSEPRVKAALDAWNSSQKD